jgi:hypothetical protein
MNPQTREGYDISKIPQSSEKICHRLREGGLIFARLSAGRIGLEVSISESVDWAPDSLQGEQHLIKTLAAFIEIIGMGTVHLRQ